MDSTSLKCRDCGCEFFHDSWCIYWKPYPNRGVKPIHCRLIIENLTSSKSAPDLLQEAAALIKQRGVERDAEDGERSMKRTVESFNSMTDHKLTEEDGWLFMMMLKLSRSRAGKIHPDDYKDLISYSALLSECALKEKK